MDYYNAKLGRQFRLTASAKQLIKKPLSDGYSLEDLKKAADNFAADDWPDRGKYQNLVYCIGTVRGINNLEKWLNTENKPKPKEAVSRL